MTPSVEDVIERLQEESGFIGNREPARDVMEQAGSLLDLLRWRDVEKEQPQKDGKYIVSINNNVDVIDVVSTCNWTGIAFVDLMGFPPVTRWLPIPPTGDSNE